jgi:hypothetical protein
MFVNYTLSSKNTWIFALLIRSAKAIYEISIGAYDEAYRMYGGYVSYLNSNLMFQNSPYSEFEYSTLLDKLESY